MLDAHPWLAIPPETHFPFERVILDDDSLSPADDVLRMIRESPRWADFGLERDDVPRAIGELSGLDASDAFRLFYRAYAARHGKQRWGDKTPPYVLRMRQVERVLPEAHFIHLIRDGRDAALSVLPLWWGPTSIEDAARWCVERVSGARAQAPYLQQYLEVRYEDLVASPEPVLRGICSFLQLPWDPAMLAYPRRAVERLDEARRDLSRADGSLEASAHQRGRIHERAAQAPAIDRIGRWRREMRPEDRAAFEHVAGAWLREWGYELSPRAM